MQPAEYIQAEILPEDTIRATALNGGKLVPKAGSEADLIASREK